MRGFRERGSGIENGSKRRSGVTIEDEGLRRRREVF
jgi:hypothetical protein